ncbi:MAG: peptide chain release factor N(5)-glutamine methyltransferase [Rubellimicrobium sp.]|nr:peptide chain release factor N(5)-glutamine methyltransferase [Rubellimicrobium sp.]
MTPREALRDAVARLRVAGVEDAAGDARRLLEHAGGIAPGLLSAHVDGIDAQALARFAALVARRAAREPVAQIIGRRAFYGRDFRVTADTLDPRPETEHLVETALAAPFARVLDLGTGTGCILLTLLAERPGATGTGTDISAPALAVAHENAARLGVAGRARFHHGDWFAGLAQTGFDLVVSNPPYIAAAEMPDLAAELAHEPRAALTDEGDGLGAYRAIAAGAGAVMVPGGRLVLEIGHAQGDAVRALLARAAFAGISLHRDLSGKPRIIAAHRP